MVKSLLERQYSVMQSFVKMFEDLAKNAEPDHVVWTKDERAKVHNLFKFLNDGKYFDMTKCTNEQIADIIWEGVKRFLEGEFIPVVGSKV